MINFDRLLNFPNTKIIKIEEIEKEAKLYIYVETAESSTSCHVCGKTICKKHGKDKELKIKHLPLFDNEVYIIYQPNRYVCDDCDHHPTTTATPSWHNQNSSYTNAYERRILLELVNSTIVDVSIKEKLTQESITGVVDRQIKTEVDWSSINTIGALAMDEIAIKKGYKNYITIISCKAEGKITILATIKGRKKAVIKAFLKSMPTRLKKTVEAVCVDMYAGYVNAAKEVFKRASIIVIDRFHVAKLYRGELDKYRQKILGDLRRALSKTEYQKIVGATNILKKNNECLTKKDKEIISELFSLSPQLMEAYRLAIKLTHIFNTHQSKAQALVKFKEWIALVRKSKLTFFNKFIGTLKKFKNEIANYFIDRNTSAFAEGLNNKIKVLKRRCYGIFNVKSLFQRLFLDVSGYTVLLGKS